MLIVRRMELNSLEVFDLLAGFKAEVQVNALALISICVDADENVSIDDLTELLNAAKNNLLEIKAIHD